MKVSVRFRRQPSAQHISTHWQMSVVTEEADEAVGTLVCGSLMGHGSDLFLPILFLI